jgi:large subunit ribosomal protein L6
MSRIGKQPVKVPSGVSVTIDDKDVTVSGTKGTLKQFRLDGIDLKQENDEIIVSTKSEEAEYRSRHGLMRTLIDNMVVGVSNGFSKKLELNGVGFRVAQAGTGLKFNLGYSHDVIYNLPEGINATIEGNVITISGISKQQVGQVAAEIRALRKPEPYKGKGIKYIDEKIIRKSGKSGKEK